MAVAKNFDRKKWIKEQEEMLENFEKDIKDIAQNFKQNPEEIADFLQFKSQFYSYSIKNTMLIQKQAPYSSLVASFKKWQERNANVLKGSKGIKIFVPTQTELYKIDNEKSHLVSKASEQIKQQIAQGKIKSYTKTSFKLGNVFDIGQTDYPKENYPKLFDMGLQSKNHAYLYSNLKNYVTQKGFPVVEKNVESVTLRGFYNLSTNEIIISDKLNDTERLSSLTHELGHAIMHNASEDKGDKSKSVIEFEADCFSILLQTKMGVELTETRKAHLAEHFEKLDTEIDIMETLQTANKVFVDFNNEFEKEIANLPAKQQEFFISQNNRKEENILNDKITDVNSYARITDSQIEQAKNVDLLNYVSARYEIKKHGSEHKIIIGEHDSIVIFRNNTWFDFANEIGGSTLDFLTNVEKKDFRNAVKELLGSNFDVQKSSVNASRFVNEKPIKKPVSLPQKDENNKRVFAYLIKTRCIDKDIVKACIDNNQIYQSIKLIEKGDKTFKFNNCVFVGFDKNNEPKYASERSMTDIYNDKIYKADITNSDKNYGFCLKGNTNATWLTICEAPIDCLSVATLNKNQNVTNENEHILSLGGVSSKAIDKFLEENPNIKVLNICLDNDEAGRKAGEKIKEKYSERFEIVESYPIKKDYNEQLKYEIETKQKEFVAIPTKNADNKITTAYLTQTKLLDTNIIEKDINEMKIYQSNDEITFDNETRIIPKTVFIEYDENKVPVYALEAIHNSSVTSKDRIKEYSTSNQSHNYLSREGKDEKLIVFNNPISMLTYQTADLFTNNECNHHMICCKFNCDKAVNNYLLKHKDIKKIILILDKTIGLNKNTGEIKDFRKDIQNDVKLSVKNKATIFIKNPKYKDCNKDYQIARGSIKIKSNKQSQSASINKEKAKNINAENNIERSI
ncbi:MAG: toprim domain-containing protein [Oscillospiraceae bacterium]